MITESENGDTSKWYSKIGGQLTEGGLSGDTEIMTVRGPVAVSKLSQNDLVYALDPTTQIIKTKPVTAIQTVSGESEVIEIDTKRSNLRVAAKQRIPFQTKDISTPRIETAENLREWQYFKFVKEWNRVPRKRVEQFDITRFLDDYEICATAEVHGHTFRASLPDGCEPQWNNSHTGYCFTPTVFEQYQSEIEATADTALIRGGPNQRGRPYLFDGDDFIAFIGWFVTEGSVYWPPDKNTAQVQIAQEIDSHRRSIATLLERMNLDFHSNERRYEMGSEVFGRLLVSLCGEKSANKRLPEFVWNLARDQLELLLEVLLSGDGNDRRTYYTASERLASDVLRLALELGYKPRYTRRRGVWQIYIREVFDGVQPKEHMSRKTTTENLYRLTVADYSVVMAGRNGKFQWVGVSNVS
ncbi:hypothetical protein AUR64_07645 [Haloprofundus marisrubri]|uniref:DOD-type homing endonuclease domain-containing protein n=1 Tax=Haloprofundus marisrubri TaxID=1514971 RepID=A0A0W1RCB1_9EURY|nr:hypothetical protein [Haloprofundus marisrubri]KTG11029.1 hypothetical protein AUR64_07645 [Haloprofundus marisrubri]